jgi:drug/metabolite transporter (DMT)-like permease
MTGKKHVLHSLHHLLTGLMLVLKGSDKISHHSIIGSVILVFGLLILGFFFYSIAGKKQGSSPEVMVLWFEAIVCLFTAYIFFTEGKRFLPYVMAAASVGFFIAIYISAQRRKKFRALESK